MRGGTHFTECVTYASDAAYWDGEELRVPGVPLPERIEDRCRALSKANVRSVLIVGDSRSRNLAEAFGGLLSALLPKKHVFDLPGHICGNHSYRYTHEVECAKVVPASELHCDGSVHVAFKACWKYDLPCFDALLEDLPRMPDLLVLSAGLHDLIHYRGHNITAKIQSMRLRLEQLVKQTTQFLKLRPTLSRFSGSAFGFSPASSPHPPSPSPQKLVRNIVYLTTPLICPPLPGRVAKFSFWARVNEWIAAWRRSEMEVAWSAGWGMVDTFALLGVQCQESYDTIHFSRRVTQATARLLLQSVVTSVHFRLAAAHQQHQLREFTSLDPDVDRAHDSGWLSRSMVGAKWSSIEGLAMARSLRAGGSNGSKWAWFGGSVTAQTLIVKDIQRRLRARGLVTTVSNFGVPASGPEYVSYCLEKMAGGPHGMNVYDVIVWEYAENDFNPSPGGALDYLLAAALRMPQRPVVFLYLHCGPRTVPRTRCDHDAYRALAKRHGIVAIDIAPWILSINSSDYPTYFRDGVHPTKQGAGAIGQFIVQVIHQGLRTLHVLEPAYKAPTKQAVGATGQFIGQFIVQLIHQGLHMLEPAYKARTAEFAPSNEAFTRHRANLTAGTMHRTRHCWTTLGSKEERNLLPMHTPAPGWSFVSTALEKYPKGKNGWQYDDRQKESSACIQFRSDSCWLEITLFYLATNTNPAFGSANVSAYRIGHEDAPTISNVTLIANHYYNTKKPSAAMNLTVAATKKIPLNVSERGSWALRFCSVQGDFRVIAIGCE
jgi:hypothetical protein